MSSGMLSRFKVVKLNYVCIQPTNKPEVLFPEVGVFKLAAKKKGSLRIFKVSCISICFIRFCPNLPQRSEMRAAYARLHTMQSCMHA